MHKKQDSSLTPSPPVSQFQFGVHGVRVVIINGEPWWVAKDACDVLEIKNARSSLALLDDDEKNSVHIMDGTPGNPEKTVINEPGLYTLILKSRKPEAKAFKRWITHEVLPQIRKTGRYAVADNYPPMSLDPMAVIRAAEEACAEIGLGPRASLVVARKFGVKIGTPKKLLPVIPPYTRKVYEITGPAPPSRKQQGEKIGASIRARRKRLKMTAVELGRQAFPGRTRDSSAGLICRMEKGQSLSEKKLAAINAVLGDEMPPELRTQELTVASSIIDRFPFIPDLCKIDLYCDKHARNERERLMPVRKLAVDVFEAWV
ncbi:BRO family, N-terminal domain [Desulfoluna spongiiphila]|uniref:BRO family, N-terminal domain n=2 Tax=Desulfoluna spongiiphila TaxID=419481 RepID=A0A1G5G203_9BACT|nr:BRO family, N-terminal domain [Desulfoluna spongiiphila]